ncbi:MAG: F0F1 ATP synthase subunit B [Bacteroidia bacterium]|nr:F0F1 ATP synthase subunit B [Bacteroidia bacterium]MCC6768330.1 F0F1 ATP synthase subunit B [Bacteroidia bacterium]
MKLVTPDIGLIIWMSLTFLTVLFLLSKFAWKPILKMIREREKSIEDALGAAEQAKVEMKKLYAGNEQLLREAMNERDQILKIARETKEQIVAEARQKAAEEAERIVASARETIRHEKMAAVIDLKNQVASLSLEVAEKLVRQQLSSDDKQKELAAKLVADAKLN